MSLNKKINKALIPLDTPSQEVNNISNLKSNSNNKRLTGFTLLEILLVIGIISIIAGITIIAINPARQLAQVRNTERKSDIKQIYNALNQYYIDNGHYPNTLLTSLTEICDTDNATSTHSIDCTNLVDLSSLVPTYLTAIPTDPKATTTGTGYEIRKDLNNKLYLSALIAELSSVIEIGIPPPWWTVRGTVDSAIVVYQPKGAQSYSSSKVNLVNPGVYNATEGLAPTWSTDTGWTFNGINQYLDTGYLPTNTANMTLIVKFANGVVDATIRPLAGTGRGGGKFFAIRSSQSGNRYYLNNSNFAVTGGAVTEGVIAIAGSSGYFNGVQDTGNAGSGMIPLFSISVGGMKYEETGTSWTWGKGDILAFALYSTTLTANQISILTTLMNNL